MDQTKQQGITIRKDGISQTSEIFLTMVQNDLSTHGIHMDGYQKQCALNAISSIYTLCKESGLSINDIDKAILHQILERVSSLRLNAFAQPREVYFQTRKRRIGNDYVTQIEMGIEGDGNDSILRNFGVDIADVLPVWVVHEGDGFVYPKYRGIEVTPPEWEPKGTGGKVMRVVYPLRMTDGSVQFLISEREDVAKNLMAHIANNMMNEAFGIAENRYKATPAQKKEIDAKKQDLKSLMFGKTLDELFTIEQLRPYISPAWFEPQSRESMLLRKMRNNAVKKFPKDFGSAFATDMYQEATSDTYIDTQGHILSEENAGPVLDTPAALMQTPPTVQQETPTASQEEATPPIPEESENPPISAETDDVPF